MKKLIILAIASALLSGCQTIAEHNAKMRADQAAGRAAAEQAKAIAAIVREATKDIHPSAK